MYPYEHKGTGLVCTFKSSDSRMTNRSKSAGSLWAFLIIRPAPAVDKEWLATRTKSGYLDKIVSDPFAPTIRAKKIVC